MNDPLTRTAACLGCGSLTWNWRTTPEPGEEAKAECSDCYLFWQFAELFAEADELRTIGYTIVERAVETPAWRLLTRARLFWRFRCNYRDLVATQAEINTLDGQW